MVPLSKTMSEQIKRIRDWATRARPALALRLGKSGMTFLAALILASGVCAQDKTAALMSASYNGPWPT